MLCSTDSGGSDGDALACLVGGMHTDASREGGGAHEGFCWDCNQAVVPCVDHVLWFCPGHADLRKVPRPPGEFAAWLGWDGSLANAGYRCSANQSCERALACYGLDSPRRVAKQRSVRRLAQGACCSRGFLAGLRAHSVWVLPPPAFPLCC